MRHPQPPTGGFGPFGPEVSRGVSEGVSPKIRVSERVSGGVSRGPSVSRAPESPKGVPRVSPECQKKVSRHSRDTLGTPFGHTGAGGPRHSPGHSLGRPDFRGHSLGHSLGHFGPEGPEASCRRLGMSQYMTKILGNYKCIDLGRGGIGQGKFSYYDSSTVWAERCLGQTRPIPGAH